jgi:hypothetical protein
VHGGRPYSRLLLEELAHLARLDPVPEDLHLVVDAAEAVEQPVGAQDHPVTGAVHPLARRAERIGQERPLGQLGLAEVAQRDPGASHVQLAGDAVGQLLAMGTQDVCPGVGHRRADRRALLGQVHRGVRADARGLGRPVDVAHRRPPPGGAFAGELAGHRLPAEVRDAQRGPPFPGAVRPRAVRAWTVRAWTVRAGVEDRAGQAGCHGGDRRAVRAAQQPVEGARVAPLDVVGEDEVRTGDQGTEGLERGTVERGRPRAQDAVGGSEVDVVGPPEDRVEQAPVRDEHALGSPRRPRRVDHHRGR